MQHQLERDRSPKLANNLVGSTPIVCPQCSSVEDLKIITCHGVDKYYCQSCLYYFSPYSSDDIWLVSELGLKFPPHDRRGESILNFSRITQEWLKNISKKFIKYKASTGISLSLLSYNLVGHKEFSTFLRSHPDINCFEDIDRSLIIQYIQENHTKGLSLRTKNSRLFSLANLFETGTTNGWFVIQPYLIRKEDYAKFNTTPLPRYIPEEVIHQLNQHLDWLPEPVMRSILVIQECGLRIGELCQLPLNCLKQDSKGGWFIQFMRSKTKSETTLPISLELVQVIEQQQAYIKQYLDANYQYLFCARKSGQKKFTPIPSVMLAQTFVRALNTLAAKFEICDRTGKRWQFQSHQFRHTVATRMINNGVPQHIVQRYLGHQSPQMTTVYAHIHDSTLRAAIDRYLGTKVVDINGEVIQSIAPELDDNSELQWLKKKVLAETLSNGYCGLPAQLTCSKGNACLTCSDFRTTSEYLDQHKQHLERTERVLEVARSNGWERQIQVNQDVKNSLEKIIATLEAQANAQNR